jgi:DNA-binding NarL/FixJ family response regulator
MSRSILIVDDHRIFREGVRNLLHQGQEYRVVGEAGDVSDAVALASKHKPDVVVLDLALNESNGLSAIVPIQRESPDSKIVVLSMNDDEAVVSHALQLGARGFVLKRASSDDLRLALRAVDSGGVYLSPEVSESLLARLQGGGAERRRSLSSVFDVLSAREFEVMELVASGKSSKDIADMLHLSVDTVRTYRKTIMRKVGVNHVAALVNLAVQAGMLRKNDGT